MTHVGKTYTKVDRNLSNRFLIIINLFEYVGGFVLGKILGNTFPHSYKIFNQQKPKENLKEKKSHGMWD